MDSRFTRPSSCPFNTQLISSDLVNMSSPGHLLDEMASRYVNDQHVIGCSVSHCTNHQHGTAMLDPASGGNLHCINSSFSNCIRSSNTILDRSDRSYYSVNQVFATGDTTGHFLRCVFSNMRTSDSQQKGGAAIVFNAVTTSLTITLCSFCHCTSTCRDGSGGAVTYSSKSPTTPSFTLLQSVFTECAANNSDEGTGGGSLFVHTDSVCLTTISDCAFERSWTRGSGGALSSENVRLTITNTLFERCSCGLFGGALRMQNTKDVLVSHCAFRGCSSGSSYSGAKDVSYDSQMNRKIGYSNFELSDSTSGSPNVYCESPRNSSSNWIAHIQRKTALKRVDLSYTENSMKMNITANSELLGSMNVLLDGAGTTRLVQVTFGQGTTPHRTGEIEVATGYQSLLPSNVSFQVRKVGIVGLDFNPSIFSVEATLIDNDHCEIKLFGMNLPDFSSLYLSVFDSNRHQVTSKHTENLTMTVTTSSSPDDPIHYGGKYTIGEIASNGVVLASPHTLSFTVPLPSAEFTSISILDCKNGSLHLTLFGERLYSPEISVTFSTIDNPDQPHSLILSLSPVSPTELDTMVIPICDEGTYSLRPDREYQVRDVASLHQTQSIEISDIFFWIPLVPPDPKKPMPAWVLSLILSVSISCGIWLPVGLLYCICTKRNSDCVDCCDSCPTPTCSRPSCHRPSCTCPSGCRPEKSAIVCCAPNNVNCCSKCCIISVTFLCCGKSQEDSPGIQNNHPTPKEVEMRYVDDYTLPHTESPRGTSRVAGRTECRQEIYRSRTTVLE
ncbi:hypothetical protein BLNAU_3374 [Blattamonas nauphoetae]|uniref:Uncharacterized protein n=1 Tax=Blattamonas nauphoetae TaxID=2049346 RepID=A0ABQ9YCS9_9EUKA|nr:hypothetical protein BLNAU_3374 [Blattamonas nauphoetae]